MDPFAGLVAGGLVALVLFLWLLGRYYPGTGVDAIGLKSAREITEKREALEAKDTDQLLAAHNERRRRRGQAEVTADDIAAEVMRGVGEQRRRGEEFHAEWELDQLLEATNERRRRRGLPERSREQARAELGEREEAGEPRRRAEAGGQDSCGQEGLGGDAGGETAARRPPPEG